MQYETEGNRVCISRWVSIIGILVCAFIGTTNVRYMRFIASWNSPRNKEGTLDSRRVRSLQVHLREASSIVSIPLQYSLPRRYLQFQSVFFPRETVGIEVALAGKLGDRAEVNARWKI